MANHFSDTVKAGKAVTKINVLCVDDEVGLSQTVKQILENQGFFDVETVSSVKEALKKISTQHFDVVISDYQMPEKNGLDFLKTLRDSGNRTPFILFTGKGREEVAVKALNLGAERFFNKFGDPETVFCELTHAIRQVVAQRRAEQKIWDREERLRAILASSPDALIIIDLEGNITDCNLNALDMLILSSKNDLIGRNYRTLFVKEHQEQIENVRKELVKHGFVKNFESMLLTKTGTKIPVEFSVNLLKNSCGNVVGAVSLARDISERKKNKLALKISEEKIRAIMCSANDAIILMDPEGNISYWNNAAERIFGYSTEEVIGKGVHDILGPQRFHGDYLKEFSNFRQTGKGFPVGLTVEMPAVKKDGTEFPSELSVSAFVLDGKWYAVSIVRDITERKNAQKVLENTEKRFRTFFENSPDYCYILSPDGDILEINKSALNCLGYDKEELIGKPILSIVYAVSSKQKAKKLFKIWKQTGKIQNQELEIITKSGEKRTILLNVHSVEDCDGQLLHSVSVQHDITERKKAEEALKASLETLKTLNEKLGVVGRMTRHDARNKLSVILNHVFLAKRQISENSNLLTHLNAIELSVEMIEKIFVFSKIYEKLGKEKLSEISVEKMFNEAVGLHSFSEKISFVNDCNSLTVLSDSLLQQLFYNLIDNSLKHGQKVNKIRLYCKQENNCIKLIYEDNGIGVPEAEKKIIFKEGYGKGTGYGLYLIEKICDVYGWSIQETGLPNNGAQFTITIPKTSFNSTDNP